MVAVPSWFMLFTHSSTELVLASHDAVVQPTFDGRVRLDMGPYLPDLRTPSGGRVGVSVQMRKTTATTTTELAQRYATIAARPDAEISRVSSAVVGLARDAALRAAGLGLLPIGLWLVVGRRRRHELWRRVRRPDWRGELRTGATAVGLVGIVVLLVAQPWRDDPERVQDTQWLPVQVAVPEVTVPKDLDAWQIQGGLVTQGTRRLLSSLFDTYDKSKVFYQKVIDRVPEVADQLHQPEKDETVAVLVSDRHDNIGMDDVVRTVADEAGATVVIDAGDDTSTGETWEEFSLDSLNDAFKGFDTKIAISGNHDNGVFVNRHLESLGWTHLDGKAVAPFGDVRITGVDDPRSSGLGNWRDEKNLSFADVKARIADDVCELDQKGDRIATLVVHDANLGATALAQGLHRPRPRGAPARPGGPGPRGRRERDPGLHLHERHDRWGGVRHRDREQAAPRRGVHLRHLPRRPSGGPPAGHREDHRLPLRRAVRAPPARPAGAERLAGRAPGAAVAVTAALGSPGGSVHLRLRRVAG